MKVIGSVIGLLLVVAFVGWITRSQLSGTRAAIRPPGGADAALGTASPAVPLSEQPRQLQQSVEGLMQTPRVPQDDTR